MAHKPKKSTKKEPFGGKRAEPFAKKTPKKTKTKKKLNKTGTSRRRRG